MNVLVKENLDEAAISEEYLEIKLKLLSGKVFRVSIMYTNKTKDDEFREL